MVSKLTHQIEIIVSTIENLSSDLLVANDKAKMHREANLESLKQEIDKQKSSVKD